MSNPQEEAAELSKGAEHIVPDGELERRLAEGRPLRVKFGVDPTARDITLGWAVALRKLRAFQDLGHTAVLIVGDFTARIGDPSGRSETRGQLSVEVVRANAEGCVAQLLQILSPDKLEVRYNSEWLEPLDVGGILRLTSHYTVAQMLERDDFSKRFSGGHPISITEFLYPLLQAYDSVAVEADLELGGTDQLFNFLVARDLQRAFGQRPQIAMTMPLLVGLDGVNKMSQSLGNYVGIEEIPEEMFGKLMSLPDSRVATYARLASDLDQDRVAELEAASARGGPPAGLAKRTMARAVVALYHGTEAAKHAEGAFDRQFVRHEAPADIPEAQVPAGSIRDGRVHLPGALVALGMASSRSDARRLIKGGGVRLDGRQVTDEEVDVSRVMGATLQVGKRRFVRISPVESLGSFD
ncbi:MAG: tyrosine--tRNA ligase [Actinobacteria bacterium]|nr:tyrosine--tRNA ligase [Actinomycetota bacterium]